MNLSFNEFLLPISTAFLIVLLIINFILFRKIKKLTRGGSGGSLENTIGEALLNIEKIQSDLKIKENKIINLEEKSKTALSQITVNRFNAFEGLGGNQSFAISILNENGDGALISSLFTRDKVSTFGKPINKWSSEYTLTKEEKDTLIKK